VAKILIVDDSAFMRMMLKDILGNNGHEIAEAENGKAGVEKYSQFKPDLVAMDIVMPEVTGIEAVRKIMQTDPDASIVMISALGQEAMVKEALEAGAKDFIVKPFKKEKVIETVNRLLS
jgi:two-component system chemotaxis response regulator CheY